MLKAPSRPGHDGVTETPAPASAIPEVTVEMVRRMFPDTPAKNIEANLPVVLNALAAPKLADKAMILMALATIRAEAESFLPVVEGPSRFNTSPGGHPFDLYDHRKDLGNQGPPDGERFKGRGFIQLIGRANYLARGQAIGLESRLVENPDLAADAHIAARLLASFLRSRKAPIQTALAQGDLKTARRLVNGGSNGFEKFQEAYNIGSGLIPALEGRAAA